ncbi:MAG: DHH family phosphoesterase [Bacteroidetes bacterium]|jgi:nanoRNase/pAp phosphatase (c-di-AMP/oligoRNAs hydrolase)|nr:DHH family phosphoesterase [Bacteroidota bacterium]
MSANELSGFLEQNRERLSPLLIVMHDVPDPDALASAVGLQFLVERVHGIRAKVVYGGVIARSENREMVRLLKLPVYKQRSSDERIYPNVAFVDTQPQFENHSLKRKRKVAIVIDQHHSETPPSADFTLIDETAGATSVLVARELLNAGVSVPKWLATAMVYGILSDTLNFYRVTNRETVDIYFKLLPLSDVHLLARIQNPSRPRKFFSDLAKALVHAVIRQRVVVSHLGPIGSPEIVSQMADVLLGAEGVDWVLCTGRHGENLHCSLRTVRMNVSVSTILRTIIGSKRHAGGHGQIAGGRVHFPGGMDQERWTAYENGMTERLAALLRLHSRTAFAPFITMKAG